MEEAARFKYFFVINVVLKRKYYDEKSIVAISKLIPQNILFVLECAAEVRLALYHTKLIQSGWEYKETASIELKGLDLDNVWENLVIQVGSIRIEQGYSLDEQISADEQKAKLKK